MAFYIVTSNTEVLLEPMSTFGFFYLKLLDVSSLNGEQLSSRKVHAGRCRDLSQHHRSVRVAYLLWIKNLKN